MFDIIRTQLAERQNIRCVTNLSQFIDANFAKQSYPDKAITLFPQRNPGILSAERVAR
jgi:hypothetical protein